MSIDQMAINLSSKLGNKLNKTKEEIEVLKYGLFIIIHTTLAILLTGAVGLISGTFIEIMLISITAASLKRYSGGIHASSPFRCIILGVLMAFMLSIVSELMINKLNFNSLIIFSVISLSFVSYTLYKKCPVGNKNKPLKKEHIRKRLRKKAFKFMIFIFVFILIAIYTYISTNINFFKVMIICVELGLILQVFGLTKNGSKFIQVIENIFDYLKII